MLEQPHFAITDCGELADLVRKYPWATLVSALPQTRTDDAAAAPETELVVSHLPVILDENEDGPGLVVLGHLAKTDAHLHQLGTHDVVLIMQGPQGYLSASWYATGTHVPTWDFVVLHLHGRPSVLDDADTLDVLSATVDHLEADQPHPWRLDTVADYARRIAPATTGFRLHPERVVGKAKLHQDETPTEALHLAAAAVLADPGITPAQQLAAAIRQANTPPARPARDAP